MDAAQPPQKVSVSKRSWTIGFTLGAVFLSGLYIGIHQAQTYARQGTAPSPITSITLGSTPDVSKPQNLDASALWKAWTLLDQNFVKTHASTSVPTDKQKLYGAIAGVVASYGDPYTTFFPPQEAKVFDQNVSGSFGGVGMEMGSDKQGNLIVIAPLKDSPASVAGVKSGDRIIAIDATSTEGMSVDAAVQLIRGPIGTPVKLTIMRAGNSEPIIITVVRNTIQIPTINYFNNAGSGIFEIDLYNFSAVSDDSFREALRAYVQSGSTKLILDLRGNPGGYLDAAVDMASFFLPVGDSIVTEDYRGTQTNVTHRSFGYNVFANKKLSMAILVDQGTASAAEILAGALQQHGVAKLVGTRTFGKGSVQQLFDLGDGAQLKITVARWLTPNGTNISDGGLSPDIMASTTLQDITAGKDPQKDAAIQYLINH